MSAKGALGKARMTENINGLCQWMDEIGEGKEWYVYAYRLGYTTSADFNTFIRHFRRIAITQGWGYIPVWEYVDGRKCWFLRKPIDTDWFERRVNENSNRVALTNVFRHL